MSPASHMFLGLVLAILSYVLNILAFSLAIPGDPISDISFPVIWERNLTDPTVFSLGQQLEDSLTGRGDIFASINGTQGQSVDPQTVNLTVKSSGYFVIYGLVIGAATSTFYISPTFVVLSPDQATSTTVNTAETYLGTSFPLTPTSTTSIPSSLPSTTSTSTNTGSTSIPQASPTTSSTNSTSSTSSAKSSNSKTSVIVGSIIGGIAGLSIISKLLSSVCKRGGGNSGGSFSFSFSLDGGGGGMDGMGGMGDDG
ncbi:hypothetical protein BDP27DRAFT_1321429 [Rhodocollybia butyracea]|uniref:Uncharacterized protein n=1 Tax=Rhodocollybia butyracea TaxID=206335 RepID=A0A9P5UA92_9AGAR|nr:hypothetical protein BDP27DRAFT_1321429 [Rhodocollybia butyracea]